MATNTDKVVFLNPKTCGIYKSGGVRFKTDPETGKRTDEIDNELIEAVDAYIAGKGSESQFEVGTKDVFKSGVIVPTYYDERYNEPISHVLTDLGVEGITIGQLLDDGILSVRGGHGSPGNDQRTGHVPYIKVSDIRAMRMNVNPTNLVSKQVAERFWRGEESGIKEWDVLTPNRASSNIGEFAIVLPGEQYVVITKEVFILRVEKKNPWTPFYLFWALCLAAVREQWRRIALMQTNREDCGSRHREIILPNPKSKAWAEKASKGFKDYFEAISTAKTTFTSTLLGSDLHYIPSALGRPDEQEANEEG